MTAGISTRLSRLSKSFLPSILLSRSSSKHSRTSELNGDRVPGDVQSASTRDPSPEARPRTTNVVLCGEAGVGKSSVVNLIAGKEIAKVSPDVNGGTMQYQRYPVSFDNIDFAIFDTVGLDQPQMETRAYLKTMEKTYELIKQLNVAGGIHLLLFCMRGGRITPTTQRNYKLFFELLCNTEVPIALVVTGLETEVDMEDWWRRNESLIREKYGIQSDGHACITAVRGDIPEEEKYTKSQETIRKLLRTCPREGQAFSPESQHWFQRTARRIKESFVPAERFPRRRDIVEVLMNCKLDVNIAKKVAADVMGEGHTEDGDQ